MKICATVAEYNPFHFGHLKHIDYIKHQLNAEKLIVIMSGNFTQRGEPSILNKYQRAKHAILAGADAVIELPAVFSTSNAELFAKGAIKILHDLNIADGLCFGVESGEKEEYISLASAMNSESKEFKRALKEHLESGVSLAKAKFLAVKSTSGGEFNESLISSPNNILGLEYTKAILALESDLKIFPMLREGDHNDVTLKKGVTSATSIRATIKAGLKKKLKKSVPPFVYGDLKDYLFSFDKIIMAALLSTPKEKLAKVADCTEGLENRIKALSKGNKTVDGLVERVSTKRYTTTRIQRILIQNLLGIEKDFIDECLDAPLYAKVLAVNEKEKNLISHMSKSSSIPIITRKSDVVVLKKTAAKCFDIDCLATELYDLSSGELTNENHTLFI